MHHFSTPSVPAALNEIVSASETVKFVVPVLAAAVLVAVSVTVKLDIVLLQIQNQQCKLLKIHTPHQH